jgi:hypothetical protein
MMLQPQWITPAGNLGTWAEGVFYQVGVQAQAGDEPVFYRLISGQLPAGVQIRSTGVIEGIPTNILSVQGVPQEVAGDVTSRFAIRAFTQLPNGDVARINDRTFEITVSGQDAPEWITPAGRIGTFYDGTEIVIDLAYRDQDPDERLRISLVAGQLPPGVSVNANTGRISGVIFPLTGPPGTATAGYDATAWDEFPYDFATRAASRNYEFTLAVSDGKESAVRNFEIYVYAKNTMTADNAVDTADNTFITADVTPARAPILLTPEGALDTVRADNFFAFQFEAIDFDGDAIEYLLITGPNPPLGNFGIPPGLVLNSSTGWLYGYIPNQGVTEFDYRWGIRLRKQFQLAVAWDPNIGYQRGSVVSFGGINYISQEDLPPGIPPTNSFYWFSDEVPTSRLYVFDMKVKGDIETDITWLTPQDLGSINNGAISTLNILATNRGGRVLQYQIVPGSDSKLPQGLTLQPSGNITGRVSFNTFALDAGTTTFDQTTNPRFNTTPTTFDSRFEFTVNAFSSLTEQLGLEIQSIDITSGGSGYSSQPTVLISPPPDVENAIQATAGVVTIVGGVITNISLLNPGRGYLTPPVITIVGGGGTGATATATMRISTIANAVSIFRRFSLTVNRQFNEPYESLYIQCMPPENDRALISQLVQNQDLIPVNLVYRIDDPNFGVARNVIYTHAFGLNPASLPEYVAAMNLNHYWRDLTLGPIRTAQARDATGQVIYEVVYSEIKDNLVNNQGVSVGKSVNLPYAVTLFDDSTLISTVYPNSLDNMRDQIVDTVGQVSPALPLWMTSRQQNGRVLGFQAAWVIAYVRPGAADRVAYNIRTRFGENLNLIDFEVDRYILDRSQTRNWDPDTESWIPQPPAATVFDQPPIPPGGPPETVFDGNSTEFITPADRWLATDEFNRYLLFPKRDILQ